MSTQPISATTERGAPVRFLDVAKSYGETVAVTDVNLDIASGEFLTLLGPSGSGKTTTLMMLAGFETPSSGEIFVGGRPVTSVAPAQRNVGMVFQSYALFPHMTVQQNVAFPLRMRKRNAREQAEQVRRVLEIVGLKGYENRYPRQLSGGQQQRVALARAIVFEPPVLLMDEPLSALDKYLRSHLQAEIRRIQRRLGITVVYVTHDQDEAMTMSDRICVMHQGRIRQIGTPEDLYQRPTDEFVAGFLGESNMIKARVVAQDSSSVVLLIGGSKVSVPIHETGRLETVQVSVRPEKIVLREVDVASSESSADAVIMETTFVGDHRRYSLRLPDGESIFVKQQIDAGSVSFRVDDPVAIQWPISAMRIFADGKSVS
jgi:spermidine/putrescine ABC transporter ATP-binding subunit